MGIIARFRDIMAANINALLDKAEDPEKMIDQYLRNLENDFASVKAETASIMAEEKAAKRKLDECDEEIAKMAEYAKKAVLAGNDAEAKQFLTRKGELEAQRGVLAQQYQLCCENSQKMREMHDKLEADITSLRSRRELLKAKVKVAETQERMSKMTSGLSATSNLAKFDEMEEKINKKLDEADAMAELNAPAEPTGIDALTAKYDSGSASATVDAELEALKAEMGLTAKEGGAE